MVRPLVSWDAKIRYYCNQWVRFGLKTEGLYITFIRRNLEIILMLLKVNMIMTDKYLTDFTSSQ